MGRKTIPPSQRNVPISISVKPHLAEKIEEYAHDRRFSRSKFLTEAVLRYINFIEMGGLEGSENVADMTLNRRFVIGLNALQEANREGETIGAHLIDAMVKLLIGDVDPTPEPVLLGPVSDEEALGDVKFIRLNEKSHGSYVYEVVQQDLRAENGRISVGRIIKRDIGMHGIQWKYEVDGSDTPHPPIRSITAMKDYVRSILELV
jgi:hypothetical protein